MPAREPQRSGSPGSSPSGLDLAPFRAVRYTTTDQSTLARRTSPAYDLIDPARRTALEQADPYNIVRLILPRREAEPDDDGPAARVVQASSIVGTADVPLVDALLARGAGLTDAPVGAATPPASGGVTRTPHGTASAPAAPHGTASAPAAPHSSGSAPTPAQSVAAAPAPAPAHGPASTPAQPHGTGAARSDEHRGPDGHARSDRAPRPDGNPYAVAARTLAAWRRNGTLRADERPALYRYEMRDGDTTTTGLVGTVALQPAEDGVILPHEDTMPGPVADRLALLEATHANFEPIVLVCDGADPLGGRRPTGAPALAVRADDGVEHAVWPIDAPADIAAIRDTLRSRVAVIADGHHRYASYLRHQARRRAAGAGPGPWDRALVYLVALGSQGLRTQPIHRILPGLDLADATRAAARAFSVLPIAVRAGAEAVVVADLVPGQFLLTDGTTWYRLSEPASDAVRAAVGTDRSLAWRGLDVTVAHSLLIADLWDLPDDETTVRFGYDVASTLASVRAPGGGTALLLPPTSPSSVLEVAAHGERMPRKSTLFVPKPRTGLLLRCFADETAGHDGPGPG